MASSGLNLYNDIKILINKLPLDVLRRQTGRVDMKWVYYGFGGFIGFVCGMVISLIFLAVERSGNPILSSLPAKFGVFGEYLLELYNALPFFGLALGIIMVRIMFQKKFEDQENGPEPS